MSEKTLDELAEDFRRLAREYDLAAELPSPPLLPKRGLSEGELPVFLGRPSSYYQGGSGFNLMVLQKAREQGAKVMFVSLEMPRFKE